MNLEIVKANGGLLFCQHHKPTINNTQCLLKHKLIHQPSSIIRYTNKKQTINLNNHTNMNINRHQLINHSTSINTNIHAAAATESPDPTVHIEWYNKHLELWRCFYTRETLEAFLRSKKEKMVVVDFYASWCTSCKAAYPALCKIAQNNYMRKNFEFVKADIQIPEIASMIKEYNVKGIPAIIVFSPDGHILTTFPASFRRMGIVKSNLAVMAQHKGSQFIVDLNGFVMPKPEIDDYF